MASHSAEKNKAVIGLPTLCTIQSIQVIFKFIKRCLLFLSHKADGFHFSHIIQAQCHRHLLFPNHKQFVHISIVQSRAHINIIHSPLPTRTLFVEIICQYDTSEKKNSYKLEEQKWNCEVIYTISQMNVKSAFSFTLIMLRRNFRLHTWYNTVSNGLQKLKSKIGKWHQTWSHNSLLFSRTQAHSSPWQFKC